MLEMIVKEHKDHTELTHYIEEEKSSLEFHVQLMLAI